MRCRLLNFTVDLPPGWAEITRELPGAPAPTIAKADGVGALQFSQAEFEGGVVESFDTAELLDIVRGIAHRADEAIAFDESSDITGPLRLGAVSLALDGNFVRVWGVSDGRGVVLATYTCGWADREREVEECTRVVESIRIVPTVVGLA
jgi:hypothetical protein